MKIHHSIAAPKRLNLSWEDSWKGPDAGLITSWERGREKSTEEPLLASQARSGQLVILPWKGGVEKMTKKTVKYGSLYYLAMWQGLRGEDLSIDPDRETKLTCSVTGTTVIFTGEYARIANA